MSVIRTLQDHELGFVTGGGGVASKIDDLAGDVSKALGRKGEPFLGRDLVEWGTAAGVTVATGGNLVHGITAQQAVRLAYDYDRKTGLCGKPEGGGRRHR
jgi:hypothetical protein